MSVNNVIHAKFKNETSRPGPHVMTPVWVGEPRSVGVHRMDAETLSIRRKAARFQRDGGHCKPDDDKRGRIDEDQGWGLSSSWAYVITPKSRIVETLIIGKKKNCKMESQGYKEIVQIDVLAIEDGGGQCLRVNWTTKLCCASFFNITGISIGWCTAIGHGQRVSMCQGPKRTKTPSTRFGALTCVGVFVRNFWTLAVMIVIGIDAMRVES